MKQAKQLCLTLAAITTLTATSITQALPLYYTFEGRLGRPTYPSGDNSLEIYSEFTGGSVNEPVTYVFLVDDQITSVELPDGTTREYAGWNVESTDGSDTFHIDYYAELVGGTGLIFEENDPNSAHGDFGGSLDYSTTPSSYYYDRPANPYLYMSGRASNAALDLYLFANVPRSSTGNLEAFSGWLTDSVNSISSRDNTLYLYDNDNNQLGYQMDLTLTAVSAASPVASVPEPATYLLMALGLIGIGAIRFKHLIQ